VGRGQRALEPAHPPGGSAGAVMNTVSAPTCNGKHDLACRMSAAERRFVCCKDRVRQYCKEDLWVAMEDS
jgi:hypothetical protein